MINFRFHLASLIAIFLALALGVVVGAGVIDRGVVDTLNNRLDSVERTSDRIKGENSQLRSENSELTKAIGDLQCPAVADTLVAEDIGIIAVRGIDEGAVNEHGRRGSVRRRQRHRKALARGQVGAGERRRHRRDGPSARFVIEEAGDAPRRGMEAAGRAPAGTGAGGRHVDRLARDAPGCGIREVRDGGRQRRDALAIPAARRVDAARGRRRRRRVRQGGDARRDRVRRRRGAARRRPDLRGRPRTHPARGRSARPLRGSTVGKSVSTLDDLDRPQGPAAAALTLAGLRQDPPRFGNYGLGDGLKQLPDAAQ